MCDISRCIAFHFRNYNCIFVPLVCLIRNVWVITLNKGHLYFFLYCIYRIIIHVKHVSRHCPLDEKNTYAHTQKISTYLSWICVLCSACSFRQASIAGFANPDATHRKIPPNKYTRSNRNERTNQRTRILSPMLRIHKNQQPPPTFRSTMAMKKPTKHHLLLAQGLEEGVIHTTLEYASSDDTTTQPVFLCLMPMRHRTPKARNNLITLFSRLSLVCAPEACDFGLRLCRVCVLCAPARISVFVIMCVWTSWHACLCMNCTWLNT